MLQSNVWYLLWRFRGFSVVKWWNNPIYKITMTPDMLWLKLNTWQKHARHFGWERFCSDPEHTFHTCSALVGLITEGQPFWCVFRGLLFPHSPAPCTWQFIWESLRRSLDALLTDLPLLGCDWIVMMRKQKGGKGGEVEERWKWRMEGRRTQRSGALDPQGSGLTQRGPFPLSSRPRPSSTSIGLSLRTRLFRFNKANPF